MQKSSVYLETSIIGYATSRPSRDLIVAAHQEQTRQWFEHGTRVYELFISQLVLQESLAGDPQAVQARQAFVAPFGLLKITEEAGALAEKLVKHGAIPRKAVGDALYVAVSAIHGIDFLLTWNCRHIANAAMRQRIEGICREGGYEPSVICTPEELSQ